MAISAQYLKWVDRLSTLINDLNVKQTVSAIVVVSLVFSFVALLVGFSFGFEVSPSEISFEIRSNKPYPKYHEIKITCSETDSWTIEYPPGFGGQTDGVGPSALKIYPLGNLSRADDLSQLKILVGNEARIVIIKVIREKIHKFIMRVFPERRTFYPGGSGKFVILLTCSDKDACGSVTFTSPKDPVSGRVGVTPTTVDLPGVATTGMGSTTYTEPKSFSVDIEAKSKNYKVSTRMSSNVAGEGSLPDEPEAIISTDRIEFVEDSENDDKYIEITPIKDEDIFVWEACPTVPWIDVEPKQGKGKGKLKVSVYPDGLSKNSINGTIEITFPGAKTVEKVIDVELLPNPAQNFYVEPNQIIISTPDIAPPSKVFVDAPDGIKWSVVKKDEWIALKETSGVGSNEIYCYVESSSTINKILKGQISITLDEYDATRIIDVIGLVAPEGFMPKEISLEQISDDKYIGQLVTGSFDRSQLIVPIQNNPSFHIWLDVEGWPDNVLKLKRVWGDKPPPEKVYLRRYIPGVTGFKLYEVALKYPD